MSRWDQRRIALFTVVRGFLRNHKAVSSVELVDTLVKNYGEIMCRRSLKVHIFEAHLDEFKDKAASSEVQGDRFHQDMMDFKR